MPIRKIGIKIIFTSNGRIRNVCLNLKYRERTDLHNDSQGFHAVDQRTGSGYSGLVHRELAAGGSYYQAVANRLDIARGQRAFNPDRPETPRIYAPATGNGGLDADRQCIRPFGNLQRTVPGRNALFVFHANAAVLLHAGCVDCLD